MYSQDMIGMDLLKLKRKKIGQLIFVKSLSFVSILILLHVDTQLSNTIIEKTSLSLLYCLCSFIKDELIVFARVCFWALCSVLLSICLLFCQCVFFIVIL